MRGKPTAHTQAGMPQSVAEVLRSHVVLELEGIDRMYLNMYVPRLQIVEGVLGFIRRHRGHKVASTAMVEPITRAFVSSIERLVAENGIPLVNFENRPYCSAQLGGICQIRSGRRSRNERGEFLYTD